MTKIRKKDKKPIYILLGFLVFFGIFIYFITRPSNQSKAISELQSCFNKKDVEMVWYKYKVDLYQDDEFILEVRKKLSSIKLSDDDIQECSKWLPPAPTSINVVIIPDLSRRIRDIPGQVHNDTLILSAIWKSFVDYSKFKQDTKDRLIVDVTDIDQAKGQFGKIANDLIFDLEPNKGKSNRLYFTPEKNSQFKTNIAQMYQSALQKPLGADYCYYFRKYLNERLKKSTLFDNYINKVIIITDGYIEAEGRVADTKIISKKYNFNYTNLLHTSVGIGNTLDVITNNGLNIPKVNIDLSNTDILICEVDEREEGKKYDFEILKAYWEDWLGRMDTKNVKEKKTFFIEREQANDITIQKINEFIKS